MNVLVNGKQGHSLERENKVAKMKNKENYAHFPIPSTYVYGKFKILKYFTGPFHQV